MIGSESSLPSLRWELRKALGLSLCQQPIFANYTLLIRERTASTLSSWNIGEAILVDHAKPSKVILGKLHEFIRCTKKDKGDVPTTCPVYQFNREHPKPAEGGTISYDSAWPCPWGKHGSPACTTPQQLSSLEPLTRTTLNNFQLPAALTVNRWHKASRTIRCATPVSCLIQGFLKYANHESACLKCPIMLQWSTPLTPALRQRLTNH